MKIIIQRDRLIQGVNDCLRAITSRTTLAILTNIKLSVEKNGLILTGSDSDISIETFIPAEEAGDEIIEIKQTGSICLKASLFSEIIKKLPQDTVELEVKENYLTTIKSGKSEFKINGLNANDYPQLPTVEKDNGYSIPVDLLKTIIKQTVYAVATTETRPILTGVNWVIEDGKLTCAATDSHRLSKKVIPFITKEQKINIIIPGKSLEELSKILIDSAESVEIFFTKNQVLFKSKNIMFYSRLLEGIYPDIERLIPPDTKTTIVLNTKDFLKSIDRASILARENRTNTVLFTSNNEMIEISSFTPEVGNVVEDIQASQFNGENLKISFNARYVIDALRTIDDEETIIRFTGIMRPFVLKGAGDDSITQLILPVRTV
ncbi:MAG: polymerase subunit beta [Bacillales bacterium]|jgi:DNA polymerase-3 subunit beta|nr:polymerase subunit beta [Bacillales bacterium]